MNTPEREDALHEALEGICLHDDQDWPCAWEQRRAHLTGALAVVKAARVWREVWAKHGPLDERTDYAINDVLDGLREFDAWEHEHATAKRE